MPTTVSAPGKIFLMGEHFVVYGKPALLSAVNKRVYTTVAKAGKNRFISADNRFLSALLDILKTHFKLKSLPPLNIKVTSEIKEGYHLGSSAAVSVSVIATVSFYLKKIWRPDIFNQLAYRAEKISHGNPSGADNSIVTFGGFIWYRKRRQIGKSIRQFPVSFSKNLAFHLIDTGKPGKTTAEMVSSVSKFYQENKEEMEKLSNLNEKATKRIAQALKNNNINEILKAIIAGEETLEKIGVVSPRVIPLIREIEKRGGAAKILGGGGKTGGVGYLLGLLSDTRKLKAICRNFGYSAEKISLGAPGVRLEKEKNNE